MIQMTRIVLILGFMLVAICHAIPQQVVLTQEDRDRIMRTELRLEEFQKQTEIQYQSIQKQFDGMQKQFDGIQKQLDNQLTFLYWGFGIIIAFMGFLLGFVIWDRRSTLAPVRRETSDLRFENQRIIDVLRKYAEKQPDIREILKSTGLL